MCRALFIFNGAFTAPRSNDRVPIQCSLMTSRRAARWYMTVVTIIGCAVLVGLFAFDPQPLGDPGAGPLTDLQLWVFLTVFAIFASVAPLPITTGVVVSVSLPPLFAGVIILHPGLAALAAVVGTIDGRVPGRQIPWNRFFFNRAMFAIVYGVGALVFRLLLALQPASTAEIGRTFAVVAAGVIALLAMEVLNSPFVIVAISLLTGESIRKVAYR